MDIVERFNARIEFIKFDSFPIPASYAGYEAARTFLEFAGTGFDTSEWNDGIEAITTGLGNFGKRWTVARKSTRVDLQPKY